MDDKEALLQELKTYSKDVFLAFYNECKDKLDHDVRETIESEALPNNIRIEDDQQNEHFKNNPKCLAYYNSGLNTIFLNAKYPELVKKAIPHEIGHAFQKPYTNRKYTAIREGLNEKKTREICRNYGFPYYLAYNSQCDMVSALEKIMGEGSTELASFNGDYSIIERRLDSVLGDGSFEKFISNMSENLQLEHENSKNIYPTEIFSMLEEYVDKIAPAFNVFFEDDLIQYFKDNKADSKISLVQNETIIDQVFEGNLSTEDLIDKTASLNILSCLAMKESGNGQEFEPESWEIYPFKYEAAYNGIPVNQYLAFNHKNQKAQTWGMYIDDTERSDLPGGIFKIFEKSIDVIENSNNSMVENYREDIINNHIEIGSEEIFVAYSERNASLKVFEITSGEELELKDAISVENILVDTSPLREEEYEFFQQRYEQNEEELFY